MLHSITQDLKSLCSNIAVYAELCVDEQLWYGKVAVKEDRIWIFCFRPEKPEGGIIVFPFRALLARFNIGHQLPPTAFLQLGIKSQMNEENDIIFESNEAVFDLVIETKCENCREINFLRICSGVTGKHYRNRTLACYAVPFYRISGRAIPHVVDDIAGSFSREVSDQKGIVWEMNEKRSAFMIWMEDVPSNTHRVKIGEVVKGFPKLAETFKNNEKLFVMDTGLVF